MKREINPVKIIKILPVPRGGRPPFLDPEWLSKVREQMKRLASAVKSGVRTLGQRAVVRIRYWKAAAAAHLRLPAAPPQDMEHEASEDQNRVTIKAEDVPHEEPASLPAIPSETVTKPTRVGLADYLRHERGRLRLRVLEAWMAARSRAARLQQVSAERVRGWRLESGRLLGERRRQLGERVTRTAASLRGQATAAWHRPSIRQQLNLIQATLDTQQRELSRLMTEVAEQRRVLEELAHHVTARNYSAARGPSEGSGGHRRGVIRRSEPGEPGTESRAAH